MNNVADLWQNILNKLKLDLSETTITTWFDELEVVDLRGSNLVLHCSNDFKKSAIESFYMKNIKEALRDMFS
ncbi:MAG: chromosomal replication initiator protein DnaA, partial [Oscillibacter sp.]|nr:chromosomal replication initiator protein DnaA [Oscillibacter sp.]